ncbi:hypothetical protein YB2330_001105 [Saitoella coloradoensis]
MLRDDLGLRSLGQRQRLLDAIEELREGSEGWMAWEDRRQSRRGRVLTVGTPTPGSVMQTPTPARIEGGVAMGGEVETPAAAVGVTWPYSSGGRHPFDGAPLAMSTPVAIAARVEGLPGLEGAAAHGDGDGDVSTDDLGQVIDGFDDDHDMQNIDTNTTSPETDKRPKRVIPTPDKPQQRPPTAKNPRLKRALLPGRKSTLTPTSIFFGHRDALTGEIGGDSKDDWAVSSAGIIDTQYHVGELEYAQRLLKGFFWRRSMPERVPTAAAERGKERRWIVQPVHDFAAVEDPQLTPIVLYTVSNNNNNPDTVVSLTQTTSSNLHIPQPPLLLRPRPSPYTIQFSTPVNPDNALVKIGNFDFDWESLRKYEVMEGGERVLPVYGESGSEGEYDEELLREMEEEEREREREREESGGGGGSRGREKAKHAAPLFAASPSPDRETGVSLEGVRASTAGAHTAAATKGGRTKIGEDDAEDILDPIPSSSSASLPRSSQSPPVGTQVPWPPPQANMSSPVDDGDEDPDGRTSPRGDTPNDRERRLSTGLQSEPIVIDDSDEEMVIGGLSSPRGVRKVVSSDDELPDVSTVLSQISLSQKPAKTENENLKVSGVYGRVGNLLRQISDETVFSAICELTYKALNGQPFTLPGESEEVLQAFATIWSEYALESAEHMPDSVLTSAQADRIMQQDTFFEYLDKLKGSLRREGIDLDPVEEKHRPQSDEPRAPRKLKKLRMKLKRPRPREEAFPGEFDDLDDGDVSEGERRSSQVHPIFKKRRTQDSTLDDASDSASSDHERSRNIRMRPVVRKPRVKRDPVADNQRRQLLLLKNIQKRADEAAKRGDDSGQFIINLGHKAGEKEVILHDYYVRTLKEHQKEGLRFMWQQVLMLGDRSKGCLLAHTMGLGKTLQVVSFLYTLQEQVLLQNGDIPEHLLANRVMILMPASLVRNWQEELRKWVPRHDGDMLGKIYTIDAITDPYERFDVINEWYENAGIMLMSYDTFRILALNSYERYEAEDAEALQKWLIKPGPSLVIADEAHKFKNKDAKISAVTRMFDTPSRIALTGSPLANSLEEYWSMIEWIDPGFLGTPAAFRNHFVLPIDDGLFLDSTPHERKFSQKKLAGLKKIIESKVHRKDITAIEKFLPSKTEFVISMPPSPAQRLFYDRYLSEIQDDLDSGDGLTQGLLGRLTILKLICSHPITILDDSTQAGRKRAKKAAADDEDADMSIDLDRGITARFRNWVVEMTNTALAPNPNDPKHSTKCIIFLQIILGAKKKNEKVLLFSQSLATLNYLQRLAEDNKVQCKSLTGVTPMLSRQNDIAAFNNDQSTTLYLISAKAGGVGLNITGASRVILFDPDWNPVWDEQSVGRAYRLGQTKPVYVYRFVTAGSYEDRMFKSNLHKSGLSLRVVDSRNPRAAAARKELRKLFSKLPEADTVQSELDLNMDDIRGKDSILDEVVEKNRDSIYRIDLTETFKKDAGDGLTAEELAEAIREAEDDKLRLASGGMLGSQQMPMTWPVPATQPMATPIVPQENGISI